MLRLIFSNEHLAWGLNKGFRIGRIDRRCRKASESLPQQYREAESSNLPDTDELHVRDREGGGALSMILFP